MTPAVSSTFDTPRVTEPSSDTSISTSCTSTSKPSAASVRPVARSLFRTAAKTSWPCRANSNAVTLPIPLEQPVTSTTAIGSGPELGFGPLIVGYQVGLAELAVPQLPYVGVVNVWLPAAAGTGGAAADHDWAVVGNGDFGSQRGCSVRLFLELAEVVDHRVG